MHFRQIEDSQGVVRGVPLSLILGIKLTIGRRALSKKERRSYVAAIYCLQEKPSLFDEKVVPGAKRLFDDFTTLHISQTPIIHNNVSVSHDSCAISRLFNKAIVRVFGLAPLFYTHT